MNFRLFAVISKKSTLGEYADEIDWNSHKFYNKCVCYLLEKVGKYVSALGAVDDDIEVIFEGRNHDYDALIRYVGKIRDNPIHPEAKYLQVFNPFAFVQREKLEERLLKYADLASHAVYQCVNKTDANFKIPEPRYLSELISRFGADEEGKIIGNGIKCIHTLRDLELDSDILKMWSSMRARPRPVPRATD